MLSDERQLIVTDATEHHKQPRWAVLLSRALGPLPAILLATAVSAWVGGEGQPWRTLALVTGLFGGAVVLVLLVLRLVGGPGTVTRRRAVPWVLGAELAVLAVGLTVGLPWAVVAAFAAYFVVGVIALAGARRNVSAHGLMSGALVGLLVGWVPAVGLVGLLVLAAVAYSRVVLGEHTRAQAVAGACLGALTGLAAALVTA